MSLSALGIISDSFYNAVFFAIKYSLMLMRAIRLLNINNILRLPPLGEELKGFHLLFSPL